MLSKSFWKNKRVLITGGTGFVGSWLCMTLLELGSDIYVISRSKGSPKSLFASCDLASKVKLYNGDIRDKQFVRKSMDTCLPEIVFHLAAQPIFSIANERPFYTYETNILGTLNIIESAQETGVKKIAFVTSEHWDGKQIDNISIYASSKACSEIVIKSLGNLFADNYPHMNIFRMINIAGGGDCELSRVIPYCIECLKNDHPIILNRPDVMVSFVYIMDVIIILLQIVQCDFSSRTWNISDIISDVEKMKVEHIRDIVVDAYKSNNVTDNFARAYSGLVLQIEDKLIKTVHTALGDAIRDSVYIGKLIESKDVDFVKMYDICRKIVTEYCIEAVVAG